MNQTNKRATFLPFSRPSIDDDALEMITESVRSGWVAMGPRVLEFEKQFGAMTGAPRALALNSATAGLHACVAALGIGPGDEVITTPMTFASTANVIIFCGARPVFADIDRHTLNIRPDAIERAITPRTKAIMPVHFAGMPCDMDAIEAIAQKHGLAIIEDSAHAVGAAYKGRTIGAGRGPRRAAVFSFHPTKNITTSEGGMVCTADDDISEFIQVFRQNGMSKGAWNRYAAAGTMHYDIPFPGLKYQMTDIQAAIGISQLRRLQAFNARRQELSARYERELAGVRGIILPQAAPYDHVHSRHIFTPFIDIDAVGFSRDEFMTRMKDHNIGTALHYQALHLFSYYAKLTGLQRGALPEAEWVSDRIVSLPLFPAMTDEDQADVVRAVKEVLA